MIKANSKWVRAVIRTDVDYFFLLHLINHEKHNQLRQWLQGSEDKEALKEIVSLLEADADYVDTLNRASCKMLWFISPFVWLAIKVVAWNLRKYAKQLREEK